LGPTELGIHLGGFANVSPAGEIPLVGETLALFGFHRLNPAFLAIEKDAGVTALGVLNQSQSRAIWAQDGVILNEIVLGEVQEICDRRNLLEFDFDKPRPPATGGASLALVIRHPSNNKDLNAGVPSRETLPAPVQTLGSKRIPRRMLAREV
jgi:hypothetical protein